MVCFSVSGLEWFGAARGVPLMLRRVFFPMVYGLHFSLRTSLKARCGTAFDSRSGCWLQLVAASAVAQVDVTGAIPEEWNADELRRKFERHIEDIRGAHEELGDSQFFVLDFRKVIGKRQNISTEQKHLQSSPTCPEPIKPITVVR